MKACRNYVRSLTLVTSDVTSCAVIRSFRHKGLRDLFIAGRSAGVRPDLRKRCVARLDAWDAATELRQVDVPGFRLHPLKGGQAGLLAIDVSGPWRITFEWSEDGDAH